MSLRDIYKTGFDEDDGKMIKMDIVCTRREVSDSALN